MPGKSAKTTPGRVEGAEILAKLDAALTDASIYANLEANPQTNQITVKMGYRQARRLAQVVQAAVGDGQA